ncbi:MFS transporter [Janibacter cremeus]|uniref:MFS family permease n=1 Tax=Janibacter cremeus TaxID=1285192 RepID=A0A852VX32_9MICO|nr:MFS family permease [Janibacter cremeus]
MASSAVWKVLGASLLTTVGSLPVFLLATQSVPVRRDLGFGEERFGMAVAAFFTAASLVAIVGGGVADRVGPRASTMIAGALSTAGGVGVALVARGWLTLVICMLVLGSANAAHQLTANLAMSRSIPAHRRGIGFGVKQSAVPVAIVLAGLAVPTMTSQLGWRSTYWTLGGVGAVVVLAGLLAPGRNHSAATPAPGAGPDSPPVRTLLVVAAAIALGSAAANSMGSFIASWGFEVGLTPSQAGGLVAAGSALNVVGRLLMGQLADRRHGRNLPVVANQMAVGGVALLAVSLPGVASYVTASLVAFGIGWSWPGLFLFAVARVGREAPAKASGYVQAGAFFGGATGPLLFGFAVDAFGYETSWRLAAVAFFAAAGLVLLSRRMFLTDLVARPPRVQLGYGGGREQPRWTTADQWQERESAGQRRDSGALSEVTCGYDDHSR